MVWDGTSKLNIAAEVRDEITQKPIVGAIVTAIRVGRDSEPLTNEHPAAMPPPQKTGRSGRIKMAAYFRAAGGDGFYCVFVGDSFLRVSAPGYRSQDVRIAPSVRLIYDISATNCKVTVPIALKHL